MPGYPECHHCPFKDDPSRICGAFAQGIRRACELIELGRQWEAKVIADSLDAGDVPRLIVTGEPVKRPSVRDLVIQMQRIEACPDRGEKIGDGCNCLYRCGRGHGSGFAGEVSVYDCQDCLDGKPPTPALGKRIR